MLHQSKKGFLLIDSLISVFITSLLCILCYSSFKAILNYDEGYINFQKISNDNLIDVYDSLYKCKVCQIDEPD